MITVVIPYFQRQPGILRKALASIDAQKACPLPVHVVVVDDASPVPAKDELQSWVPQRHTLQVIERENGGPAVARNTGLDAASAETRYIAFLDSDDEWSPDHLARACKALDAGYDLFFGDHLQLGQSVGAFARAARLQVTDHPAVGPADDGLHAYQGDMAHQIIVGNVIGTSTVVYDRTRVAKLRFRVEFVNAGEDYLFWLDLVRHGARAVFSDRIEARYGRGVNVYSGSGWGTEQFGLRVHNELRYRKTLLSEFTLDAADTAFVRQTVRTLRRSFASDVVHRLVHRKRLSGDLMRRHWQLDPASFAHIPAVMLGKLVGKA